MQHVYRSSFDLREDPDFKSHFELFSNSTWYPNYAQEYFKDLRNNI